MSLINPAELPDNIQIVAVATGILIFISIILSWKTKD